MCSLIIPSFALSEGEGGCGAPAHRGMNSQLPGSPSALLNVCLSRLLGLTQPTALATCTGYICCISKNSTALLGWTSWWGTMACLLRLTLLWAAPHTFPSEGPWGALPEGSKSAPSWPLRALGSTWVSPTSPDTDWPLSWRWGSLPGLHQFPAFCVHTAWPPSSPEVPPTLFPLPFNPTLLCLEAAHRPRKVPAASTFLAAFVTLQQHCGSADRPLLNNPGGQCCSSSKERQSEEHSHPLRDNSPICQALVTFLP